MSISHFYTHSDWRQGAGHNDCVRISDTQALSVHQTVSCDDAANRNNARHKAACYSHCQLTQYL